uniref:diacylglycerol O-acyltransferase n=1 Tax=Macrostomum lignano TaxID=282301 RepID=A0A1I8F8M5_9PLAT
FQKSREQKQKSGPKEEQRRIFGNRIARRSIRPMRRRLQTLAVLQWLLSITVMPIICVLFIMMTLLTPLAPLSLAYVAWIFFFDCNTVAARRPAPRGACAAGRCGALPDYFPIRLVKSADLDPAHNYLIGYHPHGIIKLRRGLLQLRHRGHRLQRQARGNYKLTLLKRKGFARMALQTGAHSGALLQLRRERPVQAGGQTRQGPGAPWLLPAVLLRPRVFNYTFGLPVTATRSHTVVGAPIPVEKCPEPSAEQVDRLHRCTWSGWPTCSTSSRLSTG